MIKQRQSPGLPEKPETFPDTRTCQVRRMRGWDDFVECLSLWGASCPHLLLFEQKRFCRRPRTGLGSEAIGT